MFVRGNIFLMIIGEEEKHFYIPMGFYCDEDQGVHDDKTVTFYERKRAMHSVITG